jgi:hypothetical protein
MTDPSIEIADAIWQEWQRQWEDLGPDFTLRLLLVSPADPRAVANALQAALAEVGAEFEELPPREELEGNPPLFGHWDWVLTRDGVLVTVTESDDFPLALKRVAAGWQHGGVAGRLQLADAAPVQLRVEDAVPLRTHIRVLGERSRTERGGVLWLPDRDAHRAVVEAVCEWALQLGPAADFVLSPGYTGRMRWTHDPDLAERVFDAVDRGSPISFIAAADGGGRMFRAEGVAGRVSLNAFGAGVVGDAWRGELTAVADMLRAQSASIAYAFVARGRDSWPARPQEQPWGPAQTNEAFEDLYVPDAFGLQLLAPSIAERLPPVTLWDAERLARGSTMLAATDLEAWFADVGFPPLDRARAELDSILYAKGILRDAGFGDVDPA